MIRKLHIVISVSAATVLALAAVAQDTSNIQANVSDNTQTNAADNTARNVRDRNDQTLTPLDQGNSNPSKPQGNNARRPSAYKDQINQQHEEQHVRRKIIITQ